MLHVHYTHCPTYVCCVLPRILCTILIAQHTCVVCCHGYCVLYSLPNIHVSCVATDTVYCTHCPTYMCRVLPQMLCTVLIAQHTCIVLPRILCTVLIGHTCKVFTCVYSAGVQFYVCTYVCSVGTYCTVVHVVFRYGIGFMCMIMNMHSNVSITDACVYYFGAPTCMYQKQNFSKDTFGSNVCMYGRPCFSTLSVQFTIEPPVSANMLTNYHSSVSTIQTLDYPNPQPKEVQLPRAYNPPSTKYRSKYSTNGLLYL